MLPLTAHAPVLQRCNKALTEIASVVSNGRKENVKFVNGYVSDMVRGFIICHLGIPVWLSNEDLLKMEIDYSILIRFFYS